MKYDKIILPYSYDALEPYIDALTVQIHYEKHLQSYVDNLNSLVAIDPKFFDEKPLNEILSNTNSIPVEIRQGVINQGGGVDNHNFYFSILSPNAKTMPEGRLLTAINNTFGSFDNMKEKLNKLSIGKFGSGWGWLVVNEYCGLEIITTSNQNSPLSVNKKPLIAIDVWEHAYYLKYKNLRKDYVNNIWNLIDFNIIENLYNSIC
ncbi:superoxide dismutase [Clostridium septicum]|uniref:Superoxide dismutase n=1 Tax=Clostridium septicum TaxID=1504 RepID=A0A9N7JID2_CLOSE|nr:superoxide dismutase [Clostridium septicum]AYE33033.1 superoxide dismutase [Clostridium septicum]MDU1313429.1 superoxide dismutase [Clostridium septicum]QAS61202.1 superoxide dismutase [Clostridium septicum]UEC19448.1 superoxide dismutase [Clostridium septicum]USR99599.1 superoxide dismutase [Clostridium septicum]